MSFLPLPAVYFVHWLDNAKVFHRITTLRKIDSSPLRPRPSFILTGWFMRHHLDVARGRDIVARWCAIAEQRLEYLTELFETGRWRRFHSELEFLENIQEAKAAVEIWRDLAKQEASRNSSAVEISWVVHNKPAQQRGGPMGKQEHRPKPMTPEAERAWRDVAISADTVHIRSDQAPPTPNADSAVIPRATKPVLDDAAAVLGVTAMQERYPLLRNAL